jgi:WW domain-containing oxidoreductase
LADQIVYGARTTADQVIAGVDLSGKHYVVTGCTSGIGFETMNSLAANGARVFGLGRSLEVAEAACRRAGPTCAPIACDLADLASINAAIASLIEMKVPLDGIIANAAVARLPDLQTRHGVELQFMVNCLGHFALINGLAGAVRDGGRIVIVSGAAGAPTSTGAIPFDNLDGALGYDPAAFHVRSKLALAILAREWARRWSNRGVAVNTVDPGATRGTRIDRHVQGSGLRAIRRLFMRSPQRGAATQTLLAASPSVAGITGGHFADCRLVRADESQGDVALATKLWEVCARLTSVASAGAADGQPKSGSMQAAA